MAVGDHDPSAGGKAQHGPFEHTYVGGPHPTISMLMGQWGGAKRTKHFMCLHLKHSCARGAADLVNTGFTNGASVRTAPALNGRTQRYHQRLYRQGRSAPCCGFPLGSDAQP